MAANLAQLVCAFLLLAGVSTCGWREPDPHNRNTFRAAVYDSPPRGPYEGPRQPNRTEVLEVLRPRMDAYAATARSAWGVDILVFPEYGLYPSGLSYTTMTFFAESIPPVSLGWNPCEDPTLFPRTDLQQLLSCLARRNGIYVVANLGDLVPCRSPRHNCNEQETFQYNTNVAYGPSGHHLATYHKYHLFYERAYDTPPEPEYSYFDTPFGRIGTIVCFDVLFYEPAIPLIEQHGVDILAFPTAWLNKLPYFSAVPFHSSFAIGMGVNYLSSNIHDPAGSFSGSGVFTPNVTLVYRNDEYTDTGALLIVDVPQLTRSSSSLWTPDPLIDMTVRSDGPTFQNEVFGDIWTFTWLLPGVKETAVCSNDLCCHLTYNMSETSDHWALGAFDGLHFKLGTYYLQICGFLRCASADRTSCGDPGVRTSSSYFDRFELQGNYSTPYRFPQVVTQEGNPSAGQWQWDGRRVLTSEPTKEPLVSVTVVSRLYERDSAPHD